MPRANFPWAMTFADLAMLGLLIVHFISDFVRDGFSWLIPMRMYAEWWVPYVAGRLAFQYRQDIARYLPLLAVLAVGLSSLAIIEALFRFSLHETLFGIRPPEETPRSLERWGMRRAYGPCLNPIYFGTLLLLLSTWPIVQAIRACRGQVNLLWLVALPVCVLGILGTGSRAPLLGLLILIAWVIMSEFPKSRKWGIAIVLLVGMVGLVQRESVIRKLEQWSGETRRAATTTVVINGEEQAYSPTRNRLLLFELYKIALRRSGMLGFGTEAVTGFPVRVPLGPQEIDTLNRIRYIDNTYILLTLRFGYLGVACFSLALLAAFGQYWYLSARRRTGFAPTRGEVRLIASCSAGAIAASALVLFTVWMPQDFGFVLLWSMGASSGLLLAHREGNLDELDG